MRWRLILLVATVGCSSNAPTPPPVTSADDTGSMASTDAAKDAPRDSAAEDTALPCPNEVGDIICDLPLQGFVRDGVPDGLATEAPYVTSTLYEILARGTQKYAFIWTSGYW
jgi:hypothetical protein